jgi:hypothetical protein
VIEISAKEGDKLVLIRHLTVIISRTLPLLSKVLTYHSREVTLSLRSTQAKLSARWKLEKARASQAGTVCTQLPENVGMPKHGGTKTRPAKRPKPEGSTPTERFRPLKIPRDSRGPGTFKKALTNIMVAISKKNYSEDKLI